METIVIKSQVEFDNLPKEFNNKTVIRNESDETIIVKENQINSEFHNTANSSSINHGNSNSKNFDNSSSKNHDKSSSINYDNSHSRNYDNSHSLNYNNSTSINYGSTISENYNNSVSKNFDSSSSINYNNSSSINYDKSSSINRNNSSSKNYNNSSSRNFDNSSSKNHDNSSSKNYEQSVTYCCSSLSTIKAYDSSTVYCYIKPKKLEAEQSVNIVNEIIKPSFEQWLDRGIVCADGIKQDLLFQKKIGDVTVYTTIDFNAEVFYVARNGNRFSHAKTVKGAIKDLRYKISDRDTSKYYSWCLDDTKTLEELIEAYRVITGACDEGTKIFCEDKTLNNEMTVKEAIEITKDSYGNSEFSHFFNK